MVLYAVARINLRVMYKKALAISALILIGVMGRLIPHPPNAAPITAIAFAGRYVGRFSAVAIPITAMIISDIVIGWYDWKILVSVYASFAIISLAAVWTSRDYFPTWLTIFASSFVFFLITNFAVWLFSPWYEKSISGLAYCYLLGLPFFRNMLLGDILYSGALLGAIAAFKKHRVPEVFVTAFNPSGKDNVSFQN
jgi:hypothetical protein